ncbi:MAG: type II toxin-antitoxin system HicA family toxin [Chloroflexi bacterium]|nr:type II toxin-antitoxin system HicA family toxin [Chloroflexota bacterium]NOG61906.1 type II toxin-antitoxin system HicA family toxin [Chloroflexota bacterium]
MTKPPLLSARECVKALEAVGFVVDRQRGSHIIMRRETPPPTRIKSAYSGRRFK